MMKTETRVELGSVSHGTLREEDLLVAFAEALEELLPNNEYNDAIAEAQELVAVLQSSLLWPDVVNAAASQSADCVERLMDELQAYAPPYCYFGAIEGDGSDFGFWVSWESIEDAVHGGELVKSNERVDGVECLVVSDHGNATLYDADGNEVWAIV